MSSSVFGQNPQVRYLCTLVSELAYHHVPKFEIDSNRRTKIIPCEGYINIVKGRKSTNVREYLVRLDFGNSFVVVDRGVVAVCIPVGDTLFIGFRGTGSLYDWKINLRASLEESGFHRGFAEEAFRISVKITINESAVSNSIPQRFGHVATVPTKSKFDNSERIPDGYPLALTAL